MANKVEKVVVLRYNGQNYENTADVRKALRRDILGDRIVKWEKSIPDWKDIGEERPLLEEYLADQWDGIEREISTSMTGTGID
jgi:hypothetical protein